MVNTEKVTAFINALTDIFENKQTNKKNDISGDFSTDNVSYPTVKSVKNFFGSKVTSWSSTASDSNYPSEKLVKDSLNAKISTSNTSGLVKNDGTIDTNQYLTTSTASSTYVAKENGKDLFSGSYDDLTDKPSYTPTVTSSTTGAYKIGSINIDGNNVSIYGKDTDTHQSLTNYVQKSATSGLLKNDGTVDTNTYLTSHQSLSGYEQTSHKVASWSTTVSDTNYPTEKLVKNELDNKISKSSTSGFVKNDGSIDTNTYLTQHQSLSDIGGAVTITEQGTAETGYAKTYVISQGGSALSTKINIPKDFLVKSGQVKTVSTANNPVTGYQVGDKYIDFVINTTDDSETDDHMYILVSDLVEDTTYTADNSTLQLSNGQFSVKNGGIGTTQLSSGVNTSLGYADAWNSSPAKGITATDIQNWNIAVSGGLTLQDVDDEIDDYIDAIVSALTE